MYWNSTFGAEVYDRFVREKGLYPRLNRWLARRSDLEQAKRVLDLACGTGATMLACLEILGARAVIVGVDASAAMIRIARAHVLDPRARFLIVKACDVHKEFPTAFDRVVCNAAFWQFPDRERVLAGVAHLLAPGGRLTFNLPADCVQGADAPIHPFQIALGRELQHWDSGSPEPPRVLSPALLIESAAASGLVLQQHDRTIFSCRQGELMDLMTIPPLIRQLTPALTDDERTKVLQRASRHVDPEEEVPVPWYIYSFQKLESSVSSSPVFDEHDLLNHESEESPCDTSTW